MNFIRKVVRRPRTAPVSNSKPLKRLSSFEVLTKGRGEKQKSSIQEDVKVKHSECPHSSSGGINIVGGRRNVYREVRRIYLKEGFHVYELWLRETKGRDLCSDSGMRLLTKEKMGSETNAFLVSHLSILDSRDMNLNCEDVKLCRKAAEAENFKDIVSSRYFQEIFINPGGLFVGIFFENIDSFHHYFGDCRTIYSAHKKSPSCVFDVFRNYPTSHHLWKDSNGEKYSRPKTAPS
jgi:hypothetical protein